MPSKRRPVVSRSSSTSSPKSAAQSHGASEQLTHARELVILTGISGSGKLSALKAFEDLGYYAVDNLPIELVPRFAELVQQSVEITRAVLVVDVREGQGIKRFPETLREVQRTIKTTVLYLEASSDVLMRRFSETRRPHPLGREEQVSSAITSERRMLAPLRKLADIVLDTSKFNVHELRAAIFDRFTGESNPPTLLISSMSFGYKHGVPLEADLVFDVRFLPNPHFVPEFRPLTGQDPEVAAYICKFPQTGEFLSKVTDLLLFLLPHYIHEGKSYLTVAFGCTGGQHRSVMIAEEIAHRLEKSGYRIKIEHRDMPR